jgi:serine/threonine-protein kinase HipA
MRLARELKVPVPSVGLLHLPEPIYIIERFDRFPEQHASREEGLGTVKRLHQIDLCQALSVAPSRKYESEGGLGLDDLFGILKGSFIASPIVATNAIVHWVVFSYLIGNLDAHAKNIAFLIESQHWDSMAFAAGVAPRLVRGVLSQMNSDLPEAISTVIGDERLLPIERNFLLERVLPVIEQRRQWITAAGSSSR